MQEHVQIGFDLVKGISFLADAAEIILTHHERFDGSGYPGGLKGSEIPLGARIFSIADALDAITSDRPYRRASSFAYARERIRSLSGQHFDPRVVDVFLTVPEATWPAIAKNQRQVASLPHGLAAHRDILRLGVIP
jgi:HD-GYP domain-containing protein (c-di-GMP phosphodiesterase class II)